MAIELAVNNVPLDPALRLRMQAALTALVPGSVIGLRGDRRKVLHDLNLHIFEHFLYLEKSDGREFGFSILALLDELLSCAERYYEDRTDHLSVTDYVTDLPHLLLSCELIATPRK